MKVQNYLFAITFALIFYGCLGNGKDLTETIYPEPDGIIIDSGYLNEEVLGFYDKNASGELRTVRNDLKGDLEAMVQFVQSHSVNPSGNASNNMPMLTSEREALLLVTLTPESPKTEQLAVTVSINGEFISTLEMRHPNNLFDSDRESYDDRPNVVYSRRAWSIVLPWYWIKPGLTLTVKDSNGYKGILTSRDIEMAPPSELIINNIRLGLLTDPPRIDDHYMLLEPVKAGTDYFQTVPVAELTIAKYEDVTLDRVIVSTGVIYDEFSADEGGVYSGDMREDVAKSTFSVGTNLANWGITSSGMRSQHQPQLTQTVITHHAQGLYSNGEQLHGLSGGNGMLTLIRSVGNEFSHEIGHHYGLGHYPGRDGDNDFWTTHHHDSGWGYIGHRQRMRANLHWNSTELSDEATTNVPNFKDMYRFTRDAMSGGDNASSLSDYTHYTGYSTKIRIQPSLNRAVFADDSPTGYRNWNNDSETMEVYRPEMPDSDFIWFNSEDGYYPAPRRHGVEVFTLLGGYDPEEGVGLLYPPARSNWGNVFDLPEPDHTGNERQCWLSVEFSNGTGQEIALAPHRMRSNANKLHVQVAADEDPRKAEIFCQNAGENKQFLSEVDFPDRDEPMVPAVVIGREAGYEALRALELDELEQAWLESDDGENPCSQESIRILCETYSDDAGYLSEPARTRFKTYLEDKVSGERINRWIAAYSDDIRNGNRAASEALQIFLDELGVGNDWQRLQTHLTKKSESILKSLEN